MEHKLEKKASFFPDTLLEECATQGKRGKWDVDINKYQKLYFASWAQDILPERICHEYLEGMQWILSYYTKDVPNWKWRYQYHYAPMSSLLAKYITSFVFPTYGRTLPTTPFQQLLCVLPPKSADLIPAPLSYLLTDEQSPLKSFCPDDFHIDLSGKRREWEGIVILPIVDFDVVVENYFKHLKDVDKQDLKRNILGRSFMYIHISKIRHTFKSFYGDITDCCVKSVLIDF